MKCIHIPYIQLQISNHDFSQQKTKTITRLMPETMPHTPHRPDFFMIRRIRTCLSSILWMKEGGNRTSYTATTGASFNSVHSPLNPTYHNLETSSSPSLQLSSIYNVRLRTLLKLTRLTRYSMTSV